MNQSFSLNLSKIKKSKWGYPANFSFPSEKAQHWLSEQGSLSVLLKKHCGSLTVKLLANDWVNYNQLAADEKRLLPEQEQYLIRQVVIKGDGISWVFGYSVIPKDTAIGQHYDLSDIGELPIGEIIFHANKVTRDSLVMSKIENEDGNALYARRSRLWVDGSPLLVTELFLSDSPIYS